MKKYVALGRLEPGASHMESERLPTWANGPDDNETT